MKKLEQIVGRVRKKILTGGLIFLSAGTALADRVVIWGDNPADPQSNLSQNDYIGVGAGYKHYLAIKKDGSVVGWGDNSDGQIDVPIPPIPDPNNPPENNFYKFVKVDGGHNHSVGLLEDGSIMSWGDNSDTPLGNDYIDISTKSHYNLALKSDGSIVCWGDNSFNYPDIIDPNNPNIYNTISAGHNSNLVVKLDGSLESWNKDGFLSVPEGNNYIQVDKTYNWNVALKSNGSMISWSDTDNINEYEGCYTHISTGMNNYGIAINSNSEIVGFGNNFSGELPEGDGFINTAVGLTEGIALQSTDTVYLQVTSDPNNMNTTPPIGTHEYYKGQIVNVNALVTTDCPDVYRFSEWTGGLESEVANHYLTMDGDKTISASYSLSDKVCGDECHPIQQGDINKDCYVNFDDFLLFSAEWLSCTHPDCD